jgi:ATP-dependent protease ClpP protease subunit
VLNVLPVIPEKMKIKLFHCTATAALSGLLSVPLFGILFGSASTGFSSSPFISLSPALAQSPPNLPLRPKEVGVINFFAGVSQRTLRQLITATSELRQAGMDEILINFNSYGGDSDAGLAAYNYLRSLPITIRTHNLGYVASASVKIFCAGKIRTTAPQSHFLIHYGTLSLGTSMTPLQLEGLLNASRNRGDFTTEILSTCMGQSQSRIQTLLRQEAVFNAKDAQDIGLVQQIIPQQPINLSVKHQVLIRDE